MGWTTNSKRSKIYVATTPRPPHKGQEEAIVEYEYENLRRVAYNCGEEGQAVYLPVCPTCGRFVKADGSITTNEEGVVDKTNATCSRCGPVKMPFDGFFPASDFEARLQ